MTYRVPEDHPLRRLFNGLVEQIFITEVGLCDPKVTDYLGELLGEFVHMEQIYRLRDVDGNTIRELSRMEAEAYLGPETTGSTRTCVINRYIGDFTLFWTGLYPEVLRPRRAGVDRLAEYVLQGKRSYGIAGELSDDGGYPPAAVLRRLSSEFEICVHGLHLVREGWRQMEGELGPN